MSQWDEAVGMLDRYLNKMKKKTSSTRDNDDQQSLIHEFTRERDRILALKVKSIQQEKQFYQRMFQ